MLINDPRLAVNTFVPSSQTNEPALIVGIVRSALKYSRID